MDADRSEARLLELADSIASGTPVDWDKVEAADADEAELLRSLRLIDQVAQVHAQVAGEADETGPAGQSERNRDTQPEHWRHLTILEHVGHGAFGDVYRASDTTLDRLVALKLLWTAEAPDPPWCRISSTKRGYLPGFAIPTSSGSMERNSQKAASASGWNSSRGAHLKICSRPT